MGIVTLISDFGTFYPAVMKAVILRIAPETIVIDITHAISSQNVREGAFILRETVKYFPEGTTHVAVVDPTVGTSRQALVIGAGGQYLVGPDNGLLIPAARELGDFEVMRIKAPARSSTFHGRDIFAPMGAHISLGRLPNLEPAVTFADLELQDPQASERSIVGTVLYVDRFGNCVTNISGELLVQRSGYGSRHVLNGAVSALFVRTYDEVERGDLLMTVGSFDFVELSVNQGNAAAQLNLKLGDKVRLDRL
ncbi:MAG TPA: S-adenosyl-l-methionine hydroxide adenosyltransferase family protein [Candidatus Bathyarchaeia archaeon]|nr:S-adenosyl-l-methionine hydroxide adenosyltransferase family protein [Candidatus Bathyarchaeia archaeon]